MKRLLLLLPLLILALLVASLFVFTPIRKPVTGFFAKAITGLVEAFGRLRFVICAKLWECTDWGPCWPNGTQYRICYDVRCGSGSKVESQLCVYSPKFIGDFEIFPEYAFTLIESEQGIFTHLGINYTLTLTELGPDYANLLADTTPFSVPLFGTADVDLDGDGIPDVAITLEDIGLTVFDPILRSVIDTGFFRIRAINVPPTIVTYWPQNPEPIVFLNTVVEFNVSVVDVDRDLVTVDWFVNDARVLTDTGIWNLTSRYLHAAEKNVTVFVNVSDGIFSVSQAWNLTVLPIEAVCVEDWVCLWTPCQPDGYVYAYNCTDRNNCGTTLAMPYRQRCEIPVVVPAPPVCIPIWECTPWGPCELRHSMPNLLLARYANIEVPSEERICYDRAGCFPNRLEARPCVIELPITVKIEAFPVKPGEYVVVYDILDARPERLGVRGAVIKKVMTENRTALDVLLTVTELIGDTHCFNGILDADEVDVDCGGTNCLPCLPAFYRIT